MSRSEKDPPGGTPGSPPRALWRDQFERSPSPEEVRARTLALYRDRADPWNLALEQDRFKATNEIFAARFGRVDRLIEVGCGEGLQTLWLARLADAIVGVDISPEALARARARLPEATFHVAGFPAIALPDATPRFDAVVACEVLYFADDRVAAIARLRALAPRGLLTVLERKWAKLAPAIGTLPNLRTETIAGASERWVAATWAEPGTAAASPAALS
jgi:ubiquinone/menaquinone biosynthesis C-methylase UbiE